MECGKRQVAVIGGGASGLAAAVAAARCGAETTLYEAMTRPGRKLLITGNGRCNLCNKRAGDGGVYAGMNGTDAAELAASVFARFSADKICAFFEEIGVAVRAEGDLLYPRSGQASTVLAALLKEAERLHVKLKYNTRIRSLRRDESSGRWEIGTDGWTYTADAVVLASGSKAAPETGSDGSGYALAEEAGHHVTRLEPALTGFIIEDPQLRLASGARTKARVRLVPGLAEAADADPAEAAGAVPAGRGRTVSEEIRETVYAEEDGELQWADDGISGIAVFQLSRIAAHLPEGTPLRLAIDLVPDLTEEELTASLRLMAAHMGEDAQLRQLCAAFTHERVARYIEEISGAPDKMFAASDKTSAAPVETTGLSAGISAAPAETPGAPDKASTAARLLKHLNFPIAGTRGFDRAQTTAGGIFVSEVEPDTLRSRVAEDLYLAGEILDVDGPCGGFNLAWAWASGYLAGSAAARSI